MGLGIVMEDQKAQELLNKGAEVRHSKDAKDAKELKCVELTALGRQRSCSIADYQAEAGRHHLGRIDTKKPYNPHRAFYNYPHLYRIRPLLLHTCKDAYLSLVAVWAGTRRAGAYQASDES